MATGRGTGTGTGKGTGRGRGGRIGRGGGPVATIPEAPEDPTEPDFLSSIFNIYRPEALVSDVSTAVSPRRASSPPMRSAPSLTPTRIGSLGRSTPATLVLNAPRYDPRLGPVRMYDETGSKMGRKRKPFVNVETVGKGGNRVMVAVRRSMIFASFEDRGREQRGNVFAEQRKSTNAGNIDVEGPESDDQFIIVDSSAVDSDSSSDAETEISDDVIDMQLDVPERRHITTKNSLSNAQRPVVSEYPVTSRPRSIEVSNAGDRDPAAAVEPQADLAYEEDDIASTPVDPTGPGLPNKPLAVEKLSEESTLTDGRGHNPGTTSGEEPRLEDAASEHSLWSENEQETHPGNAGPSMIADIAKSGELETPLGSSQPSNLRTSLHGFSSAIASAAAGLKRGFLSEINAIQPTSTSTEEDWISGSEGYRSPERAADVGLPLAAAASEGRGLVQSPLPSGTLLEREPMSTNEVMDVTSLGSEYSKSAEQRNANTNNDLTGNGEPKRFYTQAPSGLTPHNESGVGTSVERQVPLPSVLQPSLYSHGPLSAQPKEVHVTFEESQDDDVDVLGVSDDERWANPVNLNETTEPTWKRSIRGAAPGVTPPANRSDKVRRSLPLVPLEINTSISTSIPVKDVNPRRSHMSDSRGSPSSPSSQPPVPGKRALSVTTRHSRRSSTSSSVVTGRSSGKSKPSPSLSVHGGGRSQALLRAATESAINVEIVDADDDIDELAMDYKTTGSWVSILRPLEAPRKRPISTESILSQPLPKRPRIENRRETRSLDDHRSEASSGYEQDLPLQSSISRAVLEEETLTAMALNREDSNVNTHVTSSGYVAEFFEEIYEETILDGGSSLGKTSERPQSHLQCMSGPLNVKRIGSRKPFNRSSVYAGDSTSHPHLYSGERIVITEADGRHPTRAVAKRRRSNVKSWLARALFYAPRLASSLSTPGARSTRQSQGDPTAPTDSWKLRVHYEGFSEKHDEWVDVGDPDGMDVRRFRTWTLEKDIVRMGPLGAEDWESAPEDFETFIRQSVPIKYQKSALSGVPVVLSEPLRSFASNDRRRSSSEDSTTDESSIVGTDDSSSLTSESESD
ncbi:hypothetical protein M427DRAFT_31006 [Gonapodya prolifera JEL478]|uniref:Chromo domain-containing protein n=1 Tax=Gonapodya prolifera (strain JEL478) TaxID=1344416 RepID=A0A139AIG7_GONPJ|nr:hypothetical protein M427DRAFT_31006 [Gonapodya prolifera JEL478]|eukprot:KXS16580.1 hypothetical protein M427DRAFT_31006 [Gonapodya prolifera JEL478]